MIVQSDIFFDSLPKTADEILQKFWRLEEEAEIIINKLGSFDE